MSLAPAERETLIQTSDASEVAEIYTSQRRRITKLKKNPAARLVEEGYSSGTRWARFEINASLISFRSKKRDATIGSGQGFAPAAERPSKAR